MARYVKSRLVVLIGRTNGSRTLRFASKHALVAVSVLLEQKLFIKSNSK